jgi:hypothetical protein
VQVPSSGSITVECGVCQHPFLVGANWWSVSSYIWCESKNKGPGKSMYEYVKDHRHELMWTHQGNFFSFWDLEVNSRQDCKIKVVKCQDATVCYALFSFWCNEKEKRTKYDLLPSAFFLAPWCYYEYLLWVLFKQLIYLYNIFPIHKREVSKCGHICSFYAVTSYFDTLVWMRFYYHSSEKRKRTCHGFISPATFVSKTISYVQYLFYALR